ncbi:hypothetical protein AB0M22_16035 [Nocardia sp. NPDC051756]|uniref:hypothetical protein n=1 Tax=Nocardia sp. NPDC051756 TaxID=3154751 RepID=UPI0034201DE8
MPTPASSSSAMWSSTGTCTWLCASMIELLPCTRADGALRVCPGVLPTLQDRLAELDRRADDLATARNLLRHAIVDTERSALDRNSNQSTDRSAPQ